MKTLNTTAGTFALLAFCAVSVAQGSTATPSLPIYPGATKLANQSNRTFSTCGHKLGLVAYDSAADGKSVAKWYEGKIPGAVVIDISQIDSTSIDTEIEVFTPDGSQGAVIHQMSMVSSKLQTAAKSIGADKTGIGLETVDPPLGAD
jgi:hypothetical protein